MAQDAFFFVTSILSGTALLAVHNLVAAAMLFTMGGMWLAWFIQDSTIKEAPDAQD